MKKPFIIIIISLLSFGLNAQILSNKDGNALSDKTSFNPDYIKKNNIQRISGEFMTKKTGQNIRSQGLERVYEFDKEGRMIKSFETFKNEGKLDTLVSMFEYDNNGNLLSERFNDGHGFTSNIYTYDSLNRPTSKAIYRVKNKNGSKINFEIGEKYLVSSESYTYRKVGGVERQIIYNNHKLPYKYKIETADSLGFKKEVLIKYDKSTHLNRTKYFYNHEARIDSVSIEVKNPRRSMGIITYKYDNYGNLDTRNEYKDGKHLYKTEVIYDRETYRIDYIMHRDVITHQFTILKLLDYELFE